ncbi:LacI family transcriptional regulator [Sediminihabitans luteus]|uniref:LacI family transcriptional regulator n=1 Tax=Sediminihabitans luteus TaxID=1138585 RepID=A0A2M9CCS7_9CELL|nr:LacI family DNA-binding transcriptional regulator [Sediminihabitans luteus]PJJ69197.1 LacI family transcriptional regulator [Sediminihabitans luteus]GII98872.1 transcriptional regulator [Sediminihabitans luteus]
MGNPRSRPSIGDVAALAGVSLGTVSNVLNHPDRVSAATAEKVARAMAMLEYLPDGNARTLAAGSSRTVGIILPDLANSLFVDVARGAEAAAEEADHTLMIANSDTRLERESRYLRTFTQARVAGILLTLNDEEHYAAIAGGTPRSAPTVMLNLAVPVARSCSVSVDNALGGRLATQHLVDTGRRRLVFVGGPTTLDPIRHRERGFTDVVSASGATHVRTITPDGVNRSDGWAVGTGLVEDVRAGRVDGVVAATDLLAAGIVHALTAADVEVPGQVSVVGYDNNQAAWDSPIPISTVAQPGEAMGRAGAELVLAEARAGADHVHRAVVLEPTLVVRASTAGPTALMR